jgi:hypothetical protein
VPLTAPPAAAAPIPPPDLRGPTSLSMLTIDWDFPVYKAPAQADSTGGSSATMLRAALPRTTAFDYLGSSDPRPLLVLRECTTCSGTDDALLSTSENNEKTFLLSRWFHCVKLSPDVLEENHPFRNTFVEEEPPHLFVASRDGTHMVALRGDQSRAELWGAMSDVLDREYEKDADRALKQLFGVLNDYDRVDDRIALLEQRYEVALEKKGPGSKKLKKLARDLEKERAKKAALREEEAALLDLGLRNPEPAADATPDLVGSTG